MTFSTLLNFFCQELFLQLPGPLHPRRGFQQAQAALSLFHLRIRLHTVLTLLRTGVFCKQIQALFLLLKLFIVSDLDSGFKWVSRSGSWQTKIDPSKRKN
jgi:hypothetical protein